MPIQHAIWNVDETPTPLISGGLASEQLLEEMIAHDSRILSGEWMLIGRQDITIHCGRIDLLAIGADRFLVIFEPKRDRASREIIAHHRFP